MKGLLCSNTVVFEGFSPSLMEALVLETAIAASKALALSLFMMGSLPNGSSVLPEESGTSQGCPLTDLHTKKKPDPDNQDGSDTEDDEGDDDDDGQDDQDDDDDDDEGADEDEPGKDSEDGGDPEDEPEANGDGGSSDDDDDEDDDDEDDDDDDNDEEEDEEEDEEDIPQPQLRGGNEAKIIFFHILFYLFLLGWEFGLNRECRLGGFRVSYLHHGKKDCGIFVDTYWYF